MLQPIMQGHCVRQAIHPGLARLLRDASEVDIALAPGVIAHVHDLIAQHPCDTCMRSTVDVRLITAFMLLGVPPGGCTCPN